MKTKNKTILLPLPSLAGAALFTQRSVMFGQTAVGVRPEVSVQLADCIIAAVTLAATASSTLNAHGFAAGNLSSGERTRQASPYKSVVVP